MPKVQALRQTTQHTPSLDEELSSTTVKYPGSIRKPAGAALRLSALLIDLPFILSAFLLTRFLLRALLDISILPSPRGQFLLVKMGEVSIASSLAAQGPALLVLLALSMVYFTGFESSRLRATPGKLFLLLSVEQNDHKRISIVQGAIRFAGKLLPLLPLLTIPAIGYLLLEPTSGGLARRMSEDTILLSALLILASIVITPAAYGMSLFNKERKALHDYIAGTYVTQHPGLTREASLIRMTFALSLITVVVWAALS